MINPQIIPSVFSLPMFGLLIKPVNVVLIKFKTGLPECVARSVMELEPMLNISSKKGINIPMETIEKTIDKMVNKKYKNILPT